MLGNALRAQPLINDRQLGEVAQARAEYLCNAPFSHEGFNSFFPNDRFPYRGENLAKGYSDALMAEMAWIKSVPHYKNLLDKKWKYTGIGEACGVIVQTFGS